MWTWCLYFQLPEVAPNPTDGFGSPGGDSSDQAFVFHHVQVGVFHRAVGGLTPITFSQSYGGSERYRRSEVKFSEPDPLAFDNLRNTLGYPLFLQKHPFYLLFG